MTNVVLKERTIHEILSGRVISSVQSDKTLLFIKTKGREGVFIDFHNGPHVQRIMDHREFMMSPMYGFAEPTWSHWLKGHQIVAVLTDGKHLVISKASGEFAWVGWNVRQGPYFVKQDAHAELFGQGMEGLADMFTKLAYKRRQI